MWRPFLCALGFLTRMWLPPVALSEQDVARSAGFFPWVGGLIALVLAGTVWLMAPLGPRIAAIAALAMGAFFTGGLHLDGLADTSDGLGGARGDRARMLEIMRDSRIGAHGASALVFMTALKWAALEQVIARGSYTWLCAPVIARLVVVALLASVPYAREQGLGKAFAGRVGARELALGAAALVPVGYLSGPSFVLPALVGITAALMLVLRVRTILGGLTGDVHGAAIEVCETGMLLGLAGGLDLLGR